MQTQIVAGTVLLQYSALFFDPIVFRRE
ncbi:uncharacterized protein METZ01_LOCUS136462 [marine metagenome]|uniref:Uncharacterized protein n=1 Tax=marine metagenome TaxID=408172 RepID=A0A381Z2V1_9ZZZZ